VTNISISQAVDADGFFYAPDPSSQLACTIGGNIGMNSGGAHCLKYGVTTNNLLGVKMVMFDGSIVEIGGKALDAAGYRPARTDLRIGRPAGHRHRSNRAADRQA
jgi:glycolate oxidase